MNVLALVTLMAAIASDVLADVFSPSLHRSLAVNAVGPLLMGKHCRDSSTGRFTPCSRVSLRGSAASEKTTWAGW